jgi:hypothetical protein
MTRMEIITGPERRGPSNKSRSLSSRRAGRTILCPFSLNLKELGWHNLPGPVLATAQRRPVPISLQPAIPRRRVAPQESPLPLRRSPTIVA